MRIGVMGTGDVGQTIATKLVELDHEVMMGGREAGSEKAAGWVAKAGARADEGSFADAAGHGELLFNCTAGAHSLEALDRAGAEQLAGKILVDLANPLDFSGGMPPTLTVCNETSLAEQIQAAHPDARVVKTLNTVNHAVMTDPDSVPGEHVIFTCGDDAEAKREVTALLGDFGWPAERVIDLGGIETARGTEMYLPLWVTLYGSRGSGDFNIEIRG